MEIQAGSVVYSKAGRDKAKKLLVLKVEGEYAYVADGDLRKVDKLKKKKLKHLQRTNTVFENVNENLANSDVRKLLANHN